MKDLCCMSFLGKGNVEVLVAGRQDEMYKINIEHGRVTETVRKYSFADAWADWISR